jgi:hypothetical protein
MICIIRHEDAPYIRRLSAKEVIAEYSDLAILKEVPPIEEFPAMSILIINGDVLSRDWPEHFVHENGNYWNQCCICQNMFQAHKRTVVCKLCAVERGSA